MEQLTAAWDWIVAHWGPITLVLTLVISELLPFAPAQANGILQAVLNILKKLGKTAGTAGVLLLLGFTLTGCAGSPQTTTARTLLTIHDTVRVGAMSADAMCNASLINKADCLYMKKSYGVFREEWPKVNDTLQTYLLSDGQTGQAAFLSHYSTFMALYNQLFEAFVRNGVLKVAERR